jgi:hypothetical protein
MAKYEQTKGELVKHLKEQIAFMQASTASFDNGFEGEAKRLAIAIRILLHETEKSTSLLSQLVKKDISFYDSAIKHEPNAFQTFGLTSIRMTAGRGAGAEYKAPLDDRNIEKIDFRRWWEENIIYKDGAGNIFTRRDLVTNVADTDGGAHVDPKLKEAYANLSRFNLTGLISYVNGKQSSFKNTPVLPSIRQIAHEVLKTLKDEIPELSRPGIIRRP